MIDLKGKVVMITGAGKGIGRSTAKLFAENSAKLALITRNSDDLLSLSKEIGTSHLLFEGDVSSEKYIQDFVNDTVKKYGKVDVLINNAGMRFRKPFLEIETEEWDKVMDTNIKSVFLFCKFIIPSMLKNGSGRIINISSIVGVHGLSELCVYAASKGAMNSLTKSLAVEFAERNININCIAPGFCETSYTENFKKNKKLYDFTLERTPMKKWGKPIDIANLCLFLSSEMSNYITGETIMVDGGWSAW